MTGDPLQPRIVLLHFSRASRRYLPDIDCHSRNEFFCVDRWYEVSLDELPHLNPDSLSAGLKYSTKPICTAQLFSYFPSVPYLATSTHGHIWHPPSSSLIMLCLATHFLVIVTLQPDQILRNHSVFYGTMVQVTSPRLMHVLNTSISWMEYRVA